MNHNNKPTETKPMAQTNKRLSADQLATVSDLAAASAILIAARKRAPADSDLRKTITGIHDNIDELAFRICGYKFDDAGKHDTSAVEMV